MLMFSGTLLNGEDENIKYNDALLHFLDCERHAYTEWFPGPVLSGENKTLLRTRSSNACWKGHYKNIHKKQYVFMILARVDLELLKNDNVAQVAYCHYYYYYYDDDNNYYYRYHLHNQKLPSLDPPFFHPSPVLLHTRLRPR